MEQAKLIDTLIFDMDGVIWKGFESIGDIPWVFQTLQKKPLKIAFATNNSSRTRQQYREKLENIGIQVSADQIFTSSIAMASMLHQAYPGGGPVFIIGEDGLVEPLKEYGFYQQDKEVLAVVCGLDRAFTFEKLVKATYLIRGGAAFYGTNPDRTFPNPDGIGPGAGAILAAVEAATDTEPIFAGKPSANMIVAIMKEYSSSPENTLLIGDRLETDILAGQNAGCKTALVLSGISTLEEVEKWNPKPNYIARDLEELIRSEILPLPA